VIDLVNFAKSSLRLGNPGLIVVLLGIVAALLYIRPHAGRRLLVTLFLGFWFVSSPAGSSVLIVPLVRGFQPIQKPDQARSAGAVVVLGGGIRDLKVGADVFAAPHEGTTLRALEAARVFRLLGGRPQVIASGGPTAAGRRISEAAVIADVLAALGIPRDHILLEEQSRNTHEQAEHVAGLLRSHGITTTVLVTAPTHIWRSTAVFRAQGVDVVPSPAALVPDYTPNRFFLTPNGDSMQVSDAAFYDYAGIVYYWWRGWLRPGAAGGQR
jgi:uncharacterized SAM-binding protein YcdF (DUF218 family)